MPQNATEMNGRENRTKATDPGVGGVVGTGAMKSPYSQLGPGRSLGGGSVLKTMTF